MEHSQFRQRRQALAQTIQNGVVFVPSANAKVRSHDTDFPFRQDSFFKYLTGFNEPEAILVLQVCEGIEKSHLFLRPKNILLETWSGRRLGLEKAKDYLEIDQTYEFTNFQEKLPELLKGSQNVYFDYQNLELSQLILKATHSLISLKKTKNHRPNSLKDLSPLLGLMRLKKDANEIKAMRLAAKATAKAHKMAMSFTAPGKNERDVENLLEYVFKNEGASGNAYDSIVAGGENALILHYIENNQTLKDGDLLLIDAGSEVNSYASDVTRTFPVNGKFTGPQKEIYELVLESQKSALSVSLPGRTLGEVHNKATSVLIDGLIHHKVFTEGHDEILEKGLHREFYPHGTGHWLGLDVHDNCPYLDSELNEITFTEGMVFTIEPGLYFKSDNNSVPDHFKGIGIRTEDDILITEKSYENLSAGIPKEIKEVEEACQEPFQGL